MKTPNDTIVAVSSPPGRSARGLLRISGPDTPALLNHLLLQTPATPRQIQPATLRNPKLPTLLLRFQAPASYTGQDLAELQLPGNPALLNRILQQAIQSPNANARLAEPGEFTFRAYTAGKLDLTQAEGISATIHATSESQLAAATLLRQGKLGQTAEHLVDQLANLLALVEAGIDFTDQEDVTPIAPNILAHRITHLAATLDNILARSRSWGAIESLPRVVLVGPPSAGKSTLFNALLNRERAIIDPSPGTTRDALAEPLTLNDPDGRPVEVMLIDLAGLDANLAPDAPTPDQHAQQVVHDTLQHADLLLRIADDPSRWTPIQTTKPILDVLTKCDRHAKPPSTQSAIPVSAITRNGLDNLRAAIVHALAGQAVSIRADQLALQPRHEHAIQRAASSLKQTHQLIDHANTDRLPNIELLADTLRDALDALASLGGKLTPDDIIGRVFATFCIGK